MKKIMILLSLVILMASCASKEPEEEVNLDNTWTQIETPIEETEDAENTETWVTPTPDTGINEEPIAEEPKPVVNTTSPKPKPTVVTPPPVAVTPPPVVVTPPPVVVTPPKTTITKAEVAKHNTKSDCYTIIDAKVYDITSFFGKHPWWDSKIIWLCWIDWSAKFNSVHWESEKANITKDKYFKANLES